MSASHAESPGFKSRLLQKYVIIFFHFRELQLSLQHKEALCDDLSSQLASVLERNSALAAANSNLQRQVVELRDAGEECTVLRTTLSRVADECDSAKGEVRNLSGKVRGLESVLEEMQR